MCIPFVVRNFLIQATWLDSEILGWSGGDFLSCGLLADPALLVSVLVSWWSLRLTLETKPELAIRPYWCNQHYLGNSLPTHYAQASSNWEGISSALIPWLGQCTCTEVDRRGGIGGGKKKDPADIACDCWGISGLTSTIALAAASSY